MGGERNACMCISTGVPRIMALIRTSLVILPALPSLYIGGYTVRVAGGDAMASKWKNEEGERKREDASVVGVGGGVKIIIIIKL